jgi:hypothetical protein
MLHSTKSTNAQSQSRPRKTTAKNRRSTMEDKNKYKTSTMIEKFQIARAKFIEKLQGEYGAENVQQLFFQTSETFGTSSNSNRSMFFIARSLFLDKTLSWERTKHKIARKILMAQIQEAPQRFVWATAGHSSAAGHGNLFNESYTIVLQQGSNNLMEAVGLDFLARPYAMGSTYQGFELSSCQKEIYGLDVDILSSDFGMSVVSVMDRYRLFT